MRVKFPREHVFYLPCPQHSHVYEQLSLHEYHSEDELRFLHDDCWCSIPVRSLPFQTALAVERVDGYHH